MVTGLIQHSEEFMDAPGEKIFFCLTIGLPEAPWGCVPSRIVLEGKEGMVPGALEAPAGRWRREGKDLVWRKEAR